MVNVCDVFFYHQCDESVKLTLIMADFYTDNILSVDEHISSFSSTGLTSLNINER